MACNHLARSTTFALPCLALPCPCLPAASTVSRASISGARFSMVMFVQLRYRIPALWPMILEMVGRVQRHLTAFADLRRDRHHDPTGTEIAGWR